MPTKTNADSEEARFVFKGTVQKLKAATMSEISADQRTAIVRVDEVIHAPEVLSQYAGQNITVIMGGKKKLRKGQQSVFYSNGVLFGDSVAVEAVDYHEIEKMPAAMAAAGADPVKNLAHRDLQRRYDSADVVLSGRVVAVRMPSDVVAAFASSTAADASPIGPISEHNPDWRISEIQVEQVHKGSHKSKTAEIRFPSSTDVMWHEAPKFHTGQEGFFILHKSSRVEKAARSAPTDAGEYVAFDPADYQPFDEADGIRNLVGS